jgi:uncharacterized membrane protein
MTTPSTAMPLAGQRPNLQRDLPAATAFAWLTAGWRDLVRDSRLSIAYGLAVFSVSIVIVAGLFWAGMDAVLFPALAGFMVVGPALAVGLYEKSRRLAEGRSITLAEMIFVRTASGQILFIGILLAGLFLLWLRAAVIIYALFFGWRAFPGLEHVAGMLFTSPSGLAMLAVGSAVGALFAAFSFAISVFAVPMLLDRRRDAFTAMGHSMALVWNNRPVMVAWGAIVLGLFLLSVATGLLALIIVFPLVGHGTWHAYLAMRGDAES